MTGHAERPDGRVRQWVPPGTRPLRAVARPRHRASVQEFLELTRLTS